MHLLLSPVWGKEADISYESHYLGFTKVWINYINLFEGTGHDKCTSYLPRLFTKDMLTDPIGFFKKSSPRTKRFRMVNSKTYLFFKTLFLSHYDS